MKTGKIGALVFAFLSVLASIYVYNRFLAPAGKNISNLGQKTT